MNIPFIAGPGIPKGSIKTARLVDIFPTVLDMLGCADRLKMIGPIDGQSLLPQITKASNTANK
jgi:arylsulfatase A-like enzyme